MPRARKPFSPFRCFNSSPEVIRLVVMMYVRFPLSLRNVEHLLAERGIDICHETVRHWWNRFGPMFAGEVRRQRVSAMRGFRHWRWHLDEMYVKLNGEMVYLWRAVDHEGEVLESYITKTRDKQAALRFMKRTLKRHGSADAITTDGLRSYKAAMTELGNTEKQEVGRWANNRVENSHLSFRRRERAMLRFRQMKTLQKFAFSFLSIGTPNQGEVDVWWTGTSGAGDAEAANKAESMIKPGTTAARSPIQTRASTFVGLVERCQVRPATLNGCLFDAHSQRDGSHSSVSAFDAIQPAETRSKPRADPMGHPCLSAD